MRKGFKHFIDTTNINFGWRKIIFIFIGITASVWFIIRVISKPSRASYPCQKVAFPIASAFIIWLFGLLPSIITFKEGIKSFRKSRYLLMMVLIIPASLWFLAILFIPVNSIVLANITKIQELFIPTDGPNQPIGTPLGVNPGRVVWNYNPDATSWNGSTGYYWDDNNTSEVLVNEMLSESIDALTGATSNYKSWDSLFVYNNEQNGKGRVIYTPGEKIAIKINLSNSETHGSISHLQSMTTPAMVLAVVRQLVEYAHVPDTCITVYDASQMVNSNIFNKCRDNFPGLKFMDRQGGDGRIKVLADSSATLMWSEDLVLENGGGFPTFLPQVVSKADYIINLALLKGHDMAGITLNGKNHVGSIMATNPNQLDLTPPQAAGIHPYATVHYFSYWNLQERPMGTYNTIVDLMGHKDLGKKTVLFVVDGLYASKRQNGSGSKPNKWLSTPFNNDWTSSTFVSQDNVAIESVCLDFLRSESTQEFVYGNVDNYLHEAALAHNPASGTFYDPERDGIRLNSLGVHEHWNNSTDKKYSRNLQSGQGIQLLKLGSQKIEDLTFSHAPGIYDHEINLEINSLISGVTIYYTLDGTIPTTNSLVYNGNIIITENAIVAAVAYKSGYTPSNVKTGLFFITGLNENFLGEINYFPNPVGDQLNIQLPTYVNEDLILELLNNAGSTVYSNTIDKSEVAQLQTIDMSEFKSGIYFLVIRDKYSRSVKKIIRY